MSLFKAAQCDVYRPTRQTANDCSIVAVSSWEQGIHPLSKWRLLSHLTNQTPLHPPILCLPSSHPLSLLTSRLDLESLFRGMVLLPFLSTRTDEADNTVDFYCACIVVCRFPSLFVKIHVTEYTGDKKKKKTRRHLNYCSTSACYTAEFTKTGRTLEKTDCCCRLTVVEGLLL